MQRSRTIEVVTHVCPVDQARGEALMVGVFEGPNGGEVHPDILRFVDGFSEVKLSSLLVSGEVPGEFKDFTILHTGSGKPFERVMLIGMGKRELLDVDRLRSAAAKSARTLRKARVKSMSVDASSFEGIPEREAAQALAEGVVMGCYRVHKYTPHQRDRGTFEQLDVLITHADSRESVEDGVRWGMVISHAANFARDLANEPGNFMTPTQIKENARKVAEEHGLGFHAMDEAELTRRGMNGILSVGQGSNEDSWLIEMRYNGGGEGAPTIAFVGKGVSFDTGGISIKPAAGMGHMKYDMHGAATVIAAMKAIAQLGPKVNVIGLVPTAENMPDGLAYKPGDVVKMYSGKYVEVVNTDAEGRMLLADALAYACELKPDFVVDLATLTGAIVVSLGTMVSGLFSNNTWLTDSIREAGDLHSELYWPMPCWETYDTQIRSTVADLSNSGGRYAGATTAARFLEAFVDRPWAHLDIAGTAWIEEDSSQYVHKPYLPKKGATGVGVRTLAELARLVEKQSGEGRTHLQATLKAGAMKRRP